MVKKTHVKLFKLIPKFCSDSVPLRNYSVHIPIHHISEVTSSLHVQTSSECHWI